MMSAPTRADERLPMLPKLGPSKGQEPWIKPLDYYLGRLPRYIVLCVAGFTLFTWSEWLTRTTGSSGRDRPPETVPFILPRHIAHSLGPYSPWYPAEEYREPPKECVISQVHILQRHGSRYPTDGQTQRIQAALARVQSATRYFDSRLAFLADYEYGLGTNDLLRYGAQESWAAGKIAYNRYHKVVKHSGRTPFVRISDSERVVQSAKNWTAAFEETSKLNLGVPLIIPEIRGVNNTLDNNQCPLHTNDAADKAQKEWAKTFAHKIASRLNKLAAGATLKPIDVPALMSLCAFDTLSREKTSPWCWVFEEKEWPHYEYSTDLEKYYHTGYGSPLGPAQGIGYINELIARLTSKPVQDYSQTNKTLDSDPVTFPLDRPLYVDFTHDNEMAAIYSAMGIFDERIQEGSDVHKGIMDPTRPAKQRQWVSSRLTPFAARMVVERMDCRWGFGDDTNVGVRVLVNDAVIPIPSCGRELGGKRTGICELEAFVASQKYAREDGEKDWLRCFHAEGSS